MSHPRGITFDPAGSLLVVCVESQEVVALREDASGAFSKYTIINQTNLPAQFTLNHGIAYFQDHLYLSNDTTAYRWPYGAGQLTLATNTPQRVIRNIDGGGNHFTRTLLIRESDGRLFINVGSSGNVDPNSNRAKVRYFDLGASGDSWLPGNPDGFDFQAGAVLADGVRNECGLGLDRHENVWGVENGSDQLIRSDLGGDIHEWNPAEEMNFFGGNRTNPATNVSFGWPYCWLISDTWCRNSTNNMPPALAMQAHSFSAPLDIKFFDGSGCGVAGGFSCSHAWDAFISFHGSWNRDRPNGRKIVRVPIDPVTGKPVGGISGQVFDVWGELDPGNCQDTCFRPVGLAFDRKGHLYVSSDSSNEIWRISLENDASLRSASVLLVRAVALLTLGCSSLIH
ncbi:soluble quino protein glucose dehydrogenase [Basidiobolus meristosporus CBS 931.73]|uniref:Soluble quino protein glucose dehydrogenase n=1 Tax=Basidiobolus meristosporus CBS 931.73 TaxID=1314790 RepID=A0A1Y1YB12_9FUNG|nr:soluble quino protein glucose dehydrogenase [Basidiobolus meristosporus CBS 931.73]|eukprot:ORX95189.1 soluble quino protein glucose dehydrogenase [Basidiobolus meristosporus CBS 931.73]